MKTYMALDGLRWSRDSGSANCDIPRSAVFGRPGGGEMSGYLFRYSLGDIPMILLKYLPNTDWEGKFRVSLIC